MKIAIIGSRNCRDLTAEDVAAAVPRNCTMLLSGGAAGVDSLARQAAALLRLPLVEFLPDYERYGRKAPLVRNRQLVQEADMVLAFWDMSSRGTAHAINQCLEQFVPVHIIPINKPRQSGPDAVKERKGRRLQNE